MNQPRDKYGRFIKAAKKSHDIMMRAVLWATIGFLAGVVTEMFIQLITR